MHIATTVLMDDYEFDKNNAYGEGFSTPQLSM